MLVSLSLSDIFYNAFGYKPKSYNPEVAEKKEELKPAKVASSAYWAPGKKGMQYYMPIMLGDVQLPYPVISVSSTKNIVSTPLVNRRGNVKELISIEDYKFKIRGLVIGDANDFPESEIQELRRLYERNESLKISCPFTDVFVMSESNGDNTNSASNIPDKVVITSLTFPEQVGIINVRPYEMTLESDTSFNLIDLPK